jgi:hypothetical protein
MDTYQPLSAGPLILSRDQLSACKRIHHTIGAIDTDRLTTMIDAHLDELTSRASFDPAIDLALATLLANGLRQALATPRDDRQRADWLRTAIGYFIRADDACHDIAELGLSDDAIVVSAILEYCELPELARPLRDYLA